MDIPSFVVIFYPTVVFHWKRTYRIRFR